MRLVFSLLGFLFGWALVAASAEPLTTASASLSRFALITNATNFGPLAWRGGIELTSPNEKFGGLSGLMMSGNCTSLRAVSDAGRWVTADVSYANGVISGLNNAAIAPILDDKGRPPASKRWGDAEAVAAGPGGKTIVGFETRTRIGAYDLNKKGNKARFQNLNAPREISKGPINGELESVGYFNTGALKGNFIAIAENNFDAQGFTRAWIWSGGHSFGFSVRQLGNYRITDLAILPDGDILILQRSYNSLSLPGMAISRIAAGDIGSGKTVEPETLIEARVPFYAIDNMEGIAVCERNGEIRVNILSDNNFRTDLQRTLLLQFAYAP